MTKSANPVEYEYQPLMFRPTREEETWFCQCAARSFIIENRDGFWPDGGWYHSESCPVTKLWPRGQIRQIREGTLRLF